MCDYQGKEFGANYLDSVCIDGFLWDADSCDEPGGDLTSGGEIPCPECNHDAWLEHHRDGVETRGFEAGLHGQSKEPNPYDTLALKYEKDRETLKAWWVEGFDHGVANAAKLTAQ